MLFSNVKLPFSFRAQEAFLNMASKESLDLADIGILQKWLNVTAVKECDTHLQIAFHLGFMWVRLSG
jgi:hypothetical protein